jgi:hypothetical protein
MLEELWNRYEVVTGGSSRRRCVGYHLLHMVGGLRHTHVLEEDTTAFVKRKRMSFLLHPSCCIVVSHPVSPVVTRDLCSIAFNPSRSKESATTM